MGAFKEIELNSAVKSFMMSASLSSVTAFTLLSMLYTASRNLLDWPSIRESQQLVKSVMKGIATTHTWNFWKVFLWNSPKARLTKIVTTMSYSVRAQVPKTIWIAFNRSIFSSSLMRRLMRSCWTSFLQHLIFNAFIPSQEPEVLLWYSVDKTRLRCTESSEF